MDTTTILLLGGGTVVLGRWSQNKKADFTAMAALGFVIIMTSILANTAPKLGKPIAALFLFGTLLYYGPDIFSKFGGHSGIANNNPGNQGFPK